MSEVCSRRAALDGFGIVLLGRQSIVRFFGLHDPVIRCDGLDMDEFAQIRLRIVHPANLPTGSLG